MELENQRREFSRAADEAGACACSNDIHRALEAQLAGGIQECQGAVRSTPDRSSPLKAVLTRKTADRYQLPVLSATDGFQPMFWEAEELHSMWSGTSAAFQSQVLGQG